MYTNRRIKRIQIRRKVEEEDLSYKYLYKYNPKKREIIKSTTAVGETQEARRALEVEVNTNLEIETKLVAGIKTLLDIMSISLRIKTESNQKSLSKQDAGATLLPIFRI